MLNAFKRFKFNKKKDIVSKFVLNIALLISAALFMTGCDGATCANFNPATGSIDMNFSFGGSCCWNGGFTTPVCAASCTPCTPPACPVGTDITARPNCEAIITNCNMGSDGCGGECGVMLRACWYLENAPVPNTPTSVEMKVNTEQGELRCTIQDDVRVPAKILESGEGFKGLGSTNPRLNDSIRGLAPALSYGYRITNANAQTVVAGPALIPENNRYRPTIPPLSEGALYDIYVLASSVNRCEGSANSPELCRSFKINHKPQVVSITPVSGVGQTQNYSPNDGVSGRSNTIPANRLGQEKFDCSTDNPKIFRVVFRDLDGCGDLSRDYATDSNICGGGITPNLSLRAVNKTRLPDIDVFAPALSSDLKILDLTCNGTEAVAYFSLEFAGDENIELEIQAMAMDVLGDSSGWIAGPSWLYDGVLPSIGSLDSSSVIGINEFELKGSFSDHIANLSGVRGMRLYTQLVEGEVLKGAANYGDMTYSRVRNYVLANGVEVNLSDIAGTIGLNKNDIFVPGLYDPSRWFRVWDWNIAPSLAKNYSQYNFADRMNIGINQDGVLHFKLEAVDRACNYSSRNTHDDPNPGEVSSVFLGTPWIATRGGHVHSAGNIRLAIKNVLYSEILESGFTTSQEKTTLSTELLTLGDSLSGFTRTLDNDIFYPLLSYRKQISHSWYEILLSRAESRGYLGTEKVTVINGDFTPESANALLNCSTSNHIYFVEGNMTVNPDYFSNLGSAGDMNGCIFVVKGNIAIEGGEHKSTSGSQPKYDVIRGYFISDGEIAIKFADGEKALRDGLKVIGGLFATGGEKSIKLGRNFQLRDNFRYPVLIIFHDVRHLDTAREVLGSAFGGTYVRDIGFK